MSHTISDLDKSFLLAFESTSLDVTAFHHREHVRLAYIYLALNGVEAAGNKVRTGLLRLLEQNGVDLRKYHETLTQAWVQAVWHFMCVTGSTASADEFIERNPQLLDKSLMQSHYSPSLIEDDQARTGFVEPDLDPIPRHDLPPGRDGWQSGPAV